MKLDFCGYKKYREVYRELIKETPAIYPSYITTIIAPNYDLIKIFTNIEYNTDSSTLGVDNYLDTLSNVVKFANLQLLLSMKNQYTYKVIPKKNLLIMLYNNEISVEILATSKNDLGLEVIKKYSIFIYIDEKGSMKLSKIWD